MDDLVVHFRAPAVLTSLFTFIRSDLCKSHLYDVANIGQCRIKHQAHPSGVPAPTFENHVSENQFRILFWQSL